MAQRIHEIRRGLIVARISRKKTRQGVRHSVSISRLFRDGDLWKQSSRFGPGDLPLARHVLDLAHTWILQHQGSSQK